MSKRFKAGTRVRYTGSPILGPAYGSVGTVGLVAGARGRSTCPDPCGLMTFVVFDDAPPQGVFTKQLERV